MHANTTWFRSFIVWVSVILTCSIYMKYLRFIVLSLRPQALRALEISTAAMYLSGAQNPSQRYHSLLMVHGKELDCQWEAREECKKNLTPLPLAPH